MGSPVKGELAGDLRLLFGLQEQPSDISDHLVTIYTEALETDPNLIVELGTRAGESTRVLLRVAERCDAKVVSIDLDDCSTAGGSEHWFFVRSDDVEFASTFPEWAAARGLPGSIDVLFVDTSHLYEHTRDEIRVWFPHLNAHAKVMFHDTNLGRFYRRQDRSIGRAWDNQRGVIRAIEEYLGVEMDESREFSVVVDDWSVRHVPTCNGLTILQRLS